MKNLALYLVAFFLVASICHGKPIISDTTQSQCWFAGSDVENVFHISGMNTERLTGQWRLSAAGHTVARGETALNTETGITAFSIPFTLPQLKPGVTADLTLDLSVTESASGVQLATTNKVIHSFSHEAFADRDKWLKSLDITLFNPEKTTAELFDDEGIPYRFTKNIGALTEVSSGIVIVGENVSLQDNRGLWDELITLTTRGIPVLCLALCEGELTLPGIGLSESPIKSSSLIMKRHQAIRDLNKKFDHKSWCGKATASHSLAFEGKRGPVAARIENGSNNWLWLEQSFEGSNAKLVLCQFQLIKHWKQSPVPRYMLINMLERYDRTKEKMILTPMILTKKQNKKTILQKSRTK